jgi:hypothetical protein
MLIPIVCIVVAVVALVLVFLLYRGGDSPTKTVPEKQPETVPVKQSEAVPVKQPETVVANKATQPLYGVQPYSNLSSTPNIADLSHQINALVGHLQILQHQSDVVKQELARLSSIIERLQQHQQEVQQTPEATSRSITYSDEAYELVRDE